MKMTNEIRRTLADFNDSMENLEYGLYDAEFDTHPHHKKLWRVNDEEDYQEVVFYPDPYYIEAEYGGTFICYDFVEAERQAAEQCTDKANIHSYFVWYGDNSDKHEAGTHTFLVMCLSQTDKTYFVYPEYANKNYVATYLMSTKYEDFNTFIENIAIMNLKHYFDQYKDCDEVRFFVTEYQQLKKGMRFQQAVDFMEDGEMVIEPTIIKRGDERLTRDRP